MTTNPKMTMKRALHIAFGGEHLDYTPAELRAAAAKLRQSKSPLHLPVYNRYAEALEHNADRLEGAPTYILGADLRVGDRVKTWFMQNGTSVLDIRPLEGPSTNLFPKGANVVTFASNNTVVPTPMTLANDDRLVKVQ